MATLTTFFRTLFQGGDIGSAETGARQRHADEFALRRIPNEEIYLWVRTVDNSRVIPQANPKQAGICWKFIATACLGVCLLVGVLLPIAYNRIAGYEVSELEARRAELLRVKAELENQRYELVSPARLEALAAQQQLIDPPPETVVTLTPVSDVEWAKLH